MKFEQTINGHDLVVEEINTNTSLLVECKTCSEVLDMLSQKEWPKYRVAYLRAWVIGKEHAVRLNTTPPG